jgi:hypothetical protein
MLVFLDNVGTGVNIYDYPLYTYMYLLYSQMLFSLILPLTLRIHLIKTLLILQIRKPGHPEIKYLLP